MSGMHRDRVDPVKQGRLRLAIQVITAVFLNGYAAGFAGGKIYAGDLKKVCVPVLNCYSCPGAVGSCPIGAMQTMLGSHGRFPFYVLGLLMLFGILLGRAVCGFLCPFGLVQDLLAKIPVKKRRVPRRIDRPARYLKYVVLALLIMIPVLSRYGEPVFCKYLCPAGTLEAGIPLMIADPALRALRGARGERCFTGRSHCCSLFSYRRSLFLGVSAGISARWEPSTPSFRSSVFIRWRSGRSGVWSVTSVMMPAPWIWM